jgi:hypothetical protein
VKDVLVNARLHFRHSAPSSDPQNPYFYGYIRTTKCATVVCFPMTTRSSLSDVVMIRLGPASHLQAVGAATKRAKKGPARRRCGGLTATFTKAEFELSHCKQAPYQNPDRNRLRVSVVIPATESLPTNHHSRIMAYSISNRQLETIRNGRNPFEIKQMNFSNRPKKELYHGRQTGGAKKGEQKVNRNIPLLEFAATGGKQRDMQILIATKNTFSAARG